MGFFRCERLNFFKNFKTFAKIMVCPHDKGERELRYYGQGRGSQCSAILCGCLLWSNPKSISESVLNDLVRKMLNEVSERIITLE